MTTNESPGDTPNKIGYWVPWIVGLFAFVAFVVLIGISNRVLGFSLSRYQTVYALSMGLLGSSLFLLYNLVGVLREHQFKPDEIPKNIARLFLGPVAGWLSYFMLLTGNPEAVQPEAGPAIAGTTRIWLPFLAGFSSDLMVGIVNQAIRAIKFTLGISQVETNGHVKGKEA